MRTSLTLVLVAALAARVPAQAIHHVPQEHPTITEALEAAANGDTILVSSGTYHENVIVAGFSDLTLKAKGKAILSPETGTALTLNDCSNCTVTGFRFTDCGTGLILRTSHDVVVSKCRSSDTSVGFRIEGGNDNTLGKCRVDGTSGGNGIEFDHDALSFSHDDLVSHCKVTATSAAGILVVGPHNTVDHCTVTDTGGHGIDCSDVSNCDQDTITHCKVVGAGIDGIHFNGTSGVIAFCTVIEPVGIGLFDEGGFLDDISHCKLLRAGTVGFATGSLTVQVSIHDCTIVKAGDDGIAINGMGNVVHDNKLSKPGEDGVDVFGSSSDVSGNKVTGAADDGFVLSAGGGGLNSLSFNSAHGSGGFDFDDLAQDGTNEVDGTNNFGTTGP